MNNIESSSYCMVKYYHLRSYFYKKNFGKINSLNYYFCLLYKM